MWCQEKEDGELWTAVSGLLALISRAYHNFSLYSSVKEAYSYLALLASSMQLTVSQSVVTGPISWVYGASLGRDFQASVYAIAVVLGGKNVKNSTPVSCNCRRPHSLDDKAELGQWYILSWHSWDGLVGADTDENHPFTAGIWLWRHCAAYLKEPYQQVTAKVQTKVE